MTGPIARGVLVGLALGLLVILMLLMAPDTAVQFIYTEF